ncbi:hypothetical protein AB0M48_32970 [Lentzea sp. NPDC051208]|uniref:hypothetical protein n=1 Tax=Lentzea sp. NPDC051208 TaxID=3154642 RepID=UPI0034362EB5
MKVTSSALRYITTTLPVLSATIDGSVSVGHAFPVRESASFVQPANGPSCAVCLWCTRVTITIDTDGAVGDRTDALAATGGHEFWIVDGHKSR